GAVLRSVSFTVGAAPPEPKPTASAYWPEVAPAIRFASAGNPALTNRLRHSHTSAPRLKSLTIPFGRFTIALPACRYRHSVGDQARVDHRRLVGAVCYTDMVVMPIIYRRDYPSFRQRRDRRRQQIVGRG